MMDQQRPSFYVHYHPSEHPFVDRMTDLLERTSVQAGSRLTDFLDPRQQNILEMLSGRVNDVICVSDGGHPQAERKRAVIRHEVRSYDEADFQLAALRITSADPSVAKLTHRDFLGALLGIGIKREKTGDLFLWEYGCDLIVCRELADYILMQLHQVHRVDVSVSAIGLDEVHPPRIHMVEKAFTVASLRLDGVISDVYQLSRAKIVEPIRAGKCKVNWRIVEDPSATVGAGDLIALKGFGKCRIVACDQVTRKGRIRVTVAIYT